MSLLVRSEILGWHVAADYMYSCDYKESFAKLIQIQLSKKSEASSQIFIAFLKFTKVFEHFGKKISIIA